MLNRAVVSVYHQPNFLEEQALLSQVHEQRVIALEVALLCSPERVPPHLYSSPYTPL